MNQPIDLPRLLNAMAAHPVLPPPGALPPDSEELRSALSEIATGSRSAHWTLIREVAAAHGLHADELARRARFVLACVTLPATGTYYELLGVSPWASSREIRKRWATLIQRYHPDRAGPESGLDDQARRLIEAYQALRDPTRRRQYDAELARPTGDWRVIVPVETSGRPRRVISPMRWTWAPAVIVLAGVLVVVARWTLYSPVTPSRALPPPTPPVVANAPLVDSLVNPTSRPSGITPPPEAPPSSTTAVPLPSLVSRLRRLESGESRALAAPPGRDGAMSPDPLGEPSVAGRRDSASELPRVAAVVTIPSVPSPPVPEAAGTPDAQAKPLPSAAVDKASADKSLATTEKTPLPKREATSPRAALAATSPPRAEPAQPSREEWATLIEAFRGAYERKDLDGLMKLFAADVRERQITGRGAIHRLYARNFQILDSIRYDVTQVSAQPGSKDGDTVVHGRFRIRATHLENGSRPLDVSGPIRWVLRRDGDALQIVDIDYDVRAR